MTFDPGLYSRYRSGRNTRPPGTARPPTTQSRSFFANRPLMGGGGGTSVKTKGPSATPKRGIPERVQVKDFFDTPETAEDVEKGIMSGAGRVIQTPAAALNRPLAIANYVMGKRKDDTGPVQEALAWVGELRNPMAPANLVPGQEPIRIKDSWEMIAGFLEKANSLTSSWLNSGDVKIIRAAVRSGMSDSTVLDQETVNRLVGQQAAIPGSGITGMIGAPRTGAFLFGLTGERTNMTLGEYKAQLSERGFNYEVQEDGTLQEVSWEDVARKAETPGDFGISGEYMFGDKAVNDSEIVDMAWRMGSDPLNLAFGTGLIGKAGQLARWSTRPVMALSPAGTPLRSASWGVGYIDDMARLGVRETPLLPAPSAVGYIAQGQMARVGLKGLGMALRIPRAVFLPGATQVERRLAGQLGMGINDTLLRRYVRGSLRLQLGGAAVEHGAGAASNFFKGFTNGEENIISKPFSDLYDLSEAIMNDNPLADDPLFIVVAAFGTPVVPVLRSDIRAIRGGARETFGPNTIRKFAEHYEPEVSVGRFESITGVGQGKRGRAREQRFLQRLEPSGGLGRLLNFADEQLVKAQWTDDFRLAIETMDELAHGGSFMADLVASEVAHLRATGRATTEARLAILDQWARNQGQRMRDSAGNDLGPLPPEHGFAGLPTEAILEQWADYVKVQDALRSRFEPLAGAVVARANRLSRQDLELLMKVAESRVVNGNIDTGFMRGLLVKNGAMLEDITANYQFWRTLMNLGVAEGTGVFKGTEKFTYDWATVQKELRNLIDNAPTREELFHEARMAERTAKPLEEAPIGPVSGGGARQVSTVAKLESLREQADPHLRTLVRDIRLLRERYNERWTKHNTLRAEPKLRRQAPRIMETTIKNEGGTFDASTGLPVEINTGYGVGRAQGTFAEVGIGNSDALAAAAVEISARYPKDYLGTWLNEGIVHVDPATVISDLGEAMAQARMRNQRAIWDYANNKEILNPDYRPEFPEPWRDKPQAKHSELVPISYLQSLRRGNPVDPKRVKELADDIRQNGMEEPIPLTYSESSRSIVRDEGNHRIDAAAVAGLDAVPVHFITRGIDFSQRYKPLAKKVPGIEPDAHGYVPGNLKPSDIGVPIVDRPPATRPSPRQSIDEIRQGEQVEMRAKRAEAKRIKAELRAMESEVQDILTTKIDPSFTDRNGNPLVTGNSLNLLKEQTRLVQEESFGRYQLERGPGVTIPWKVGDSHIAALAQERSNLGRILFDYGPVAKVTRLFDYLTEKVPSSVRARDARQMVANKMLPLGHTPEQVMTFFNMLREAAEAAKLTPLQIPLFRGVSALPKSQINKIGQAAFGDSPTFMNKYAGRYDVMLDESFNSLVRKIDTKVLMGKPNSRLDRLFRSGYWHWQNDPGFAELSGAVRFISRVVYPLFRFTVDPRWIGLNIIEADIIGVVQDGINGTRFSRRVPTELQMNAVALHANRSRLGGAVPEAQARELGIRQSGLHPQELRDEMGAILFNRMMSRVVRNQFVNREPANIARIIDSLPRESGMFKTLVDKFGPETKTWSEQLNEMVYGFDKKGVEATLLAEANRLAKFDGWTAQEYTAIRPLLRQLIDLNQKTMDDLIAVHVGNVDRSRLERLGNSYWLYWPLSYQIKATKWLMGALTERAGGHATNLGGLWTVQRLHDEFVKQTAISPEFRQQLKDDETIWFTLGMLMPMSPFDIGVSLNRATRYVGGNILGLWPEYDYTPAELILKMLELGPIYSAELLGRIWNAIKPEEETEIETDGGFTPPTY